jgi:hypothetical protein
MTFKVQPGTSHSMKVSGGASAEGMSDGAGAPPPAESFHHLAESVMLHDIVRDHIKILSPKPGDFLVVTIPARFMEARHMQSLQEALMEIVNDMDNVRAMIVPEGCTIGCLPHTQVVALQRHLDNITEQLANLKSSLVSNPIMSPLIKTTDGAEFIQTRLQEALLGK